MKRALAILFILLISMSKNLRDEYVVPLTILWTDAGDAKIQIQIWLEISGETISLDDADVLAIIASIKPVN